MNRMLGLILTLISGIFFLVGGLISLKVKDKNKLNNFSIALSFMVMLGLIFFDLLPDILELLDKYPLNNKIILIIIFATLGFLLLKALDFFIPTHNHKHKDNEKNKEEHISHIHHIGILTIISLILHNILEGFLVLAMTINNFKAGILFALSVLLHNIPLGTHIFGAIDLNKNKFLASFLALSSFIGGLIFLIVGNVNNIILGIVSAITLGMILYITLLELLPEIKTNKGKKETIMGLLLGIVIIFISSLI